VSVSEFKPGWLPDGYEQTYSESDDFSIFNRYEGKDGGSVSIQKLLGVGAGLAADSEDALIQSITVGGCAAVMVEKDGVCEITWANEDTKTFFVVCTENLPSEVAVKIADNLIY
jgi:hypothetical protein